MTKPLSPPAWRTALLTTLAMLAFAGNSLLCRLALRHTPVDAASFTSMRLASGALVLALLVALRSRLAAGASRGVCGESDGLSGGLSGDWISATALFVYAAGFSFAYVSLSAATGALLLFGTVQTTMIGWGLWRGERLRAVQWLGLLAASAGLLALLLPGLSTPSLASGGLMVSAGGAWAVYSLRGRSTTDATATTAGNFARAAPLALGLSLLMASQARFDATGLLLAAASGAVASGLGYAVWYTALRGLSATRAAVTQLSVPALAAAGGVLLLGEPVTPHLLAASAAVLGGVALVIVGRQQRRT